LDNQITFGNSFSGMGKTFSNPVSFRFVQDLFSSEDALSGVFFSFWKQGE
jgi:hypothetical protein